MNSNPPSNLGVYVEREANFMLPSMKRPKRLEVDTNNMQATFFAPISCNLSLGELLSYKLEISNNIAKYVGQGLAGASIENVVPPKEPLE